MRIAERIIEYCLGGLIIFEMLLGSILVLIELILFADLLMPFSIVNIFLNIQDVILMIICIIFFVIMFLVILNVVFEKIENKKQKRIEL